ncbi:MAG: nucleotidyltransferase domain-containing protein [Butyrivibrio sp.]|nr:nucleotidyltransferase domain-containing protein [Acetatifactor muris]MCM1561042.1 nucleotidyltransferase domain-containing protein [Butyrivibrio sp.]
MNNELIREKVLSIVDEYPIKRITLFGSRAEETNQENSDVDLIMEFSEPISLLMLSDIKLQLEDILGLKVDIVHGPIREGDLLEVGKEIELYAA